MPGRPHPEALTAWWRENRSWAFPTGCLAVLLPVLSLASCAGAFATFAFAVIRLGTSLRRRD